MWEVANGSLDPDKLDRGIRAKLAERSDHHANTDGGKTYKATV
jgi:hypothetical protein